MTDPAGAPGLVLVACAPAVGRGLAADLGARYGAARVVAAVDGAEALRVLGARSRDVAVALVAGRLPDGSGIDVLREVRRRHPAVRRALLSPQYVSDPAEYDAGRLLEEALDEGVAQAVVPRPWQPAADRLYPPLDDLLEGWQLDRDAEVATVTLVSPATSAHGNGLRDLLTRNGLPHEWLDPGSARGGALRARAGAAAEQVVVALHNGALLVDPGPRQIAERLGVRMRPEREAYDLVVVGAGPAGLATAVYGASEGLHTLVVEAEAFGGQAGTSSRIENYLGFPSGISGGALMHRAGIQAVRLGAETVIPLRATSLDRRDGWYVVGLDGGAEVRTRAVVLALGVTYRRLLAAGTEALVGSGVHYGSPTVQLPGVAGGQVFIVGGGNSAGQAAVRLAESAARVTLVVRARSLAAGMSHYLVEQLAALPTVRVVTGTEVAACHGDERLTGLTLRSASGDAGVPADALFVMIGAVPGTGWLPPEVLRDPAGFVRTGPDLPPSGDGERPRQLLETAAPGVFAVGDVRSGSVKRVAAAVGEGSVVVSLVHGYLAGLGEAEDAARVRV
ncbi:NAD(P)/FAD-dependent oxidoreductase [Geodermatophilus marinus]|uniref:FAD-dependent oxidoreductase n=1 Tax=Geodermatophilus sp. LHW52908 TaxID=2303986 RepID=UPI0011C1474C|nr:FAD-dependent oxidoreductase [Geodermatophilus sp. LHW52908]